MRARRREFSEQAHERITFCAYTKPKKAQEKKKNRKEKRM